MDRNTLTGLVLMMALLLGYQWYMAPTDEEVAQWEAEQARLTAEEDSTAAADYAASQAALNATAQLQAASENDGNLNPELDAELRRRFGEFGPGVIGTDRDLVMSNDQVRVTFSTRGGLPVAATLQDGYTRYGGDEPVSLWVREQSDMNVAWDVPGVGRVGFQDLHFKPISEGPTQLVLESDLGDNNAIRVVHKLEGYQVKTDIIFIGVERLTERQRLFTWNALGQRNEKGLQWERQHSAIYYLELGEERDYLSDGQEDDEGRDEQRHPGTSRNRLVVGGHHETLRTDGRVQITTALMA